MTAQSQCRKWFKARNNGRRKISIRTFSTPFPKWTSGAVQQFFREAQQRFQGDYVVDMAALRQTAQTVLPEKGSGLNKCIFRFAGRSRGIQNVHLFSPDP
jgi:hypothetical protein